MGFPNTFPKPSKIGRAAHSCALVVRDITQMKDAMMRFDQLAFGLIYYDRLEVSVRLCYGVEKVAAPESQWDRDDKCMVCQGLYHDDDGTLDQLATRMPRHGKDAYQGYVFHLQCAYLWFKKKRYIGRRQIFRIPVSRRKSGT